MALLSLRRFAVATALASEDGKHSLYLDLELPSDRAKLAKPEVYFAHHIDKLVIKESSFTFCPSPPVSASAATQQRAIWIFQWTCC